MNFLRPLFSLLLFVFSLPAATTYQAAVTSTTSHYIAQSTHGIACTGQYGVRVLDSSGNRYLNFSISRDGSCNVTFTWPNSFTGTVRLRGPFSPTAASTDFEASVWDGDEDTDAYVRICASCTTTNYAYRVGYGVMEASRYFLFGGQGEGMNATVRAWINEGKLYFSTSTSAGGSCIGGLENDCEVQTNVSSFPSGVKEIFECVVTHPNNQPNRWGTCVDKRSF